VVSSVGSDVDSAGDPSVVPSFEVGAGSVVTDGFFVLPSGVLPPLQEARAKRRMRADKISEIVFEDRILLPPLSVRFSELKKAHGIPIEPGSVRSTIPYLRTQETR
jgi:hypothetical protein